MTIFAKTVSYLLTFTAGILFSLWFIYYQNLKDEYAYVLKINNAIFNNITNNRESVNTDLNNLLYYHSNRYFHIRNYLPFFLKDEIDVFFCSAFPNSSDDLIIYRNTITKKDLLEYLNKNLTFCNPATL